MTWPSILVWSVTHPGYRQVFLAGTGVHARFEKGRVGAVDAFSHSLPVAIVMDRADVAELEAYRDSVRRFVAAEFVPRQPLWREQRRPDAADWRAAGRAGLLLPDVPLEHGGGGGSFAHAAVVGAELARAGVVFGAAVQGLVAQYLLAWGGEAQQRDWLPRMAAGELVAAIAMTEPDAGSDLGAIRCRAVRDGDTYVIDGAKMFVTNGALAGLVCLAVRTGEGQPAARALSLLMVETAGLSGYRVGAPLRKVGQHGQDTCELSFDGVRVPAANLLGGVEGRALGQMMRMLPYERLSIALAALAGAERAVELTTAYARQRQVGGKPLFELQDVRFKLAAAAADLRVGRAYVDACVAAQAAGGADAAAAAVAKFWLTESQFRIADACVQIHGGYGYVEESEIARLWADSRVQRIYGGANEVMQEIVAWSL